LNGNRRSDAIRRRMQARARTARRARRSPRLIADAHVLCSNRPDKKLPTTSRRSDGMSARISLLIGFLLAGSAQAASTIAPGVDIVPGTFVAGTQPDGNSVIFSGRDGLVVFDTGRHPEHTQKIIDFAAAAKKPVVAIVNSHWHLDHVGGNVLLRQKYPNVRVYASGAIDDALHGFLANYRTQLEELIAKAGDDAAKAAPWRAEIALIDAGPSLAPDERIVEGGMRTIAGHAFRIGYESHAVTAGDVWLYDPPTRVLASGDLVTLPAPLFDTACPEHWRAALDRLAAVDFKTLVPGHGAPMRKSDLAIYRRAFDGLLECAAGVQPKQACLDGWMHDAAPLIPASDEKLARSLLDYYVDQSLRGDAQKREKFCTA
jgi:glyoxylase-like metal-dependent hydrolase (beta-lactamase superfamily II)